MKKPIPITNPKLEREDAFKRFKLLKIQDDT